MNDVLWHVSVLCLLTDQATCFDVGRNAAFLGDTCKFGSQGAIVISVGQTARSGLYGRGQHATRMAGVVHDKQFVSFARDGAEQARHFAVRQHAFTHAVKGQQSLNAAANLGVFVTCAVA